MSEESTLRQLGALAIFISYIIFCASLPVSIIRDLQKATRSEWRRKSVGLFVFLTAASLTVTWLYMLRYFALSYRTWCFDHVKTEDFSRQQLGAWLRDVQLFRDAWEVTTETHARLFWSQPIFFITAAWSLFLAQEGRALRIPKLWRFMLLGQIVAISFAVNLFFLAVLLATEKSGSTNSRPIPAAIHHFILDATPAILTAGSVVLLPYVANTPYYMTVLALPHIALFLPLMTSPSGSGRGLKCISWAIIGVAGFVQLQTWNKAQTDGPDSHLHRHSRPFNTDAARNLQLEHAGVASNVLGALYDHPAVSSVGWDTLLCSISFAAWYLVNRQPVATKVKPVGKQQ